MGISVGLEQNRRHLGYCLQAFLIPSGSSGHRLDPNHGISTGPIAFSRDRQSGQGQLEEGLNEQCLGGVKGSTKAVCGFGFS